jgi:pimeloyl-ACP methyl ester carboxylesterase
MHYIDVGEGPETIVFAHSFLFSSDMFARQIEHLRPQYRCIAYDHRGQGQSPVTKTGYDINELTDDAIKLIEDLNVGPCHFVGLSMGGMVGMRLALKRPYLLKSLTLMDTSADPQEEADKKAFKTLAFIGRWFGFGPLAKKIMPLMFARTFMNDPVRAAERQKWMDHIGSNSKIGASYTLKGLVNSDEIFDRLPQIKTPTLVIVGAEDASTPPEKSENIQRQIAGSKLVLIPHAGHSTSIEEPEAVNSALAAFLSKL